MRCRERASAEAGKLKGKVVKSSQDRRLETGIRVSVSGKPGSRVRLIFQSSSFDEGVRALARPKRIRLGSSGRRVLSVRLTPAARTATGTCSARTLSVTGQLWQEAAKDSFAMVRNRPDCRVNAVDLSRAADCDFIAQPKEGMCHACRSRTITTRATHRRTPRKECPPASASTSRRVACRQNKSKKPIDPTASSASDGFSQGQAIVLKVPGLDTPTLLSANDFVGLIYTSAATPGQTRRQS